MEEFLVSLSLICSCWLSIGLIFCFVFILLLNKGLRELKNEIKELKESILEKTSRKSIISEEPEPQSEPENQPEENNESIAKEKPSSEQKVNYIQEEKPEKLEEEKVVSYKFSGEDFKISGNLETFIGGKLLNWIGAIALLIGMAFFLKYAFDQNWINETVRILIGVALGGGLLYGGYYFHKKEYTVFSQGLAGTGIGILYLSFYAAYNFYHLMPYSVAIGLMVIVTLLAIFQALYYDAIVIGALGIIGGFLTPLVLTTDFVDVTNLFTYLVFLNVLNVVLLYKKDSWRFLEFVGLFFTCIIFWGWYATNQFQEVFREPVIFVTVVWLIYYGLGIYRVIKGLDSRKISNAFAVILVALFYYSALFEFVDVQYPQYSGIITFMMAIIYFSTLVYLHRFAKKENLPYRQYGLTAIVFLTMAIEIQYQGYSTVVLYSLEALTILAFGIEYKKSFAWKAGLVIFIIAILKLLYLPDSLSFDNLEDYCPIFNYRSAATLILIGSLGISGLLFNENVESKARPYIQAIIRFIWLFISAMYLMVEIADMFDYYTEIRGVTHPLIPYIYPLVQSSCMMLFSLPITWYGINSNLRVFKYFGGFMLWFALLAIIITSITYNPIDMFVPVANFRFTVMLLAIGSLYIVSKWLKETESENSHFISRFLTYCWVIVCFILCTVEINDTFNYYIYACSSKSFITLDYYRPLAMSIVWTLIAFGVTFCGIKSKSMGFIILGMTGFLLSIITIVTAGIVFNPIESFYPVCNLRFLAVIVVITTLVILNKMLLEREKELQYSKILVNVIRIVSCTFVFILLSYEVSDVYNKDIYSIELARVENQDYKEHLANMKQFAMSAVWLIYSICLLTYGILQKVKTFRYAAIVFFGFAIVKIFVLDLAYLDTLNRIFSFIGLGVILLGVSYLYHRYKDIIIGSEDVINTNSE